MNAAVRIGWAVVLAGLFSLGALARQEPGKEPGKTREPQASEARPKEEPTEKVNAPAVAAPIDPKRYVIGSQDVVLVRVWREQELSSLYVVRPDGKISMPLIGDVSAGGSTPDELKERITTALEVFMNKPDVMIEVRQVNSKRYFITGEVGRPGPYPLVTPVTMLEAISNAGGLRDFANGKKIVVLRNGERIKFNYKEVIKGKNSEQNILVENGDHIIVP